MGETGHRALQSAPENRKFAVLERQISSCEVTGDENSG